MKIRRKGFILAEMMISMAVLILIISMELTFLRMDHLEKRKVMSCMDNFSWTVTSERLESLKGDYSSSLALLSDGKAAIVRNQRFRFFDAGGYIIRNSSQKKDTYTFTDSFHTMSQFYGNSGFTVEIVDQEVMAKIVYYVITSTFRDVVY